MPFVPRARDNYGPRVMTADTQNRTVGIMAWRIQSTVRATKSLDPVYATYYIVLQSHLEIWLGITGASLPTLAPIASEVIYPTFSKLVSSYRNVTPQISSRQKAIRTIGSSGDDVPLQRTGFSRLPGESLAGFDDVQYSGTAESTKNQEDMNPSNLEPQSRDALKAITVRHEYDISIEPGQQV